MDNLWPDFGEISEASTPGAILKEQARALGETFQNKIIGEIVVRRSVETFAYSFQLKCPLLSYRYALFKAEYHLIELYPVKITIGGDIAHELCGTKETSVLEAKDEEELKKHLARIFSARKTKHLIHALRQHLE